MQTFYTSYVKMILELLKQNCMSGISVCVCVVALRILSLFFLGSTLLIERWMVLELMVMSLLHAGRSYLRSGVRREAMFYLSQGLRFCQAFCLRKR